METKLESDSASMPTNDDSGLFYFFSFKNSCFVFRFVCFTHMRWQDYNKVFIFYFEFSSSV